MPLPPTSAVQYRKLSGLPSTTGSEWKMSPRRVADVAAVRRVLGDLDSVEEIQRRDRLISIDGIQPTCRVECVADTVGLPVDPASLRRRSVAGNNCGSMEPRQGSLALWVPGAPSEERCHRTAGSTPVADLHSTPGCSHPRGPGRPLATEQAARPPRSTSGTGSPRPDPGSRDHSSPKACCPARSAVSVVPSGRSTVIS